MTMTPQQDQSAISLSERWRRWKEGRGPLFPVIVLVGIGALVGIGWSFLQSSPPPVAITQSTTQRAPGVATPALAGAPGRGGEIRVYIVGAVQRPGVYSLQPGDRIENLVRLAGGLTAEAD